MCRLFLLPTQVIVLSIQCIFSFGDEPTAEQASHTLKKAAAFFSNEVSTEGGYLWRYSSDLTFREGEGKASDSTVWVQPPGTPAVGEALLTAFQATEDPYFLECAQKTAMALVRGQLQSGGWDYRIEFGEARKKYAYRTDNRTTGRNVTTLDDNTTQAALTFLMRVDRALKFENKLIHQTVEYALEKLLEAQYPNGAWPQRFSERPDPKQFPVLKANYPESWPRRHPDVDYRSFYTFNDNTLADMIETMFEAERIYGGGEYTASAEKAGDFILLAQMPAPQAAWAQQYNAQMQPAWARRFEPASVTGGESQGVLRVLMMLYQNTGEEKFLDAIAPALEYLSRSQLPDGRLARFYELKTNRPLYFTKDYQLTYDDSDLPTHYSFQVGSRLDSIRSEYDQLRLHGATRSTTNSKVRAPRVDSVRAAAASAIQQIDDRGAWLTSGQLRNYPDAPVQNVIDSRVFIANTIALCRFIESTKAAE